MTKKVAVILAAYNGEEVIEAQIRSILSNSSVELTIFVSDDGSSDATREVVSKFSLANVVLIDGPKLGSASRNFFSLFLEIDLEEFDFIALSDQDDIWKEGKLDTSLLYMEEKQANAVSSDVIAFWPDGKEKYLKKSHRVARFDYFFESGGPGCTYVIDRETTRALKVFMETNWETVSKFKAHDWFIYAFVRNRNRDWYIIPEATMWYRQHGSNVAGANSGLRAKVLRLQAAVSGWYMHDMRLLFELFEHPQYLHSAVFPAHPLMLFRLLANFRHLRRSLTGKLFIGPLLLVMYASRLIRTVEHETGKY